MTDWRGEKARHELTTIPFLRRRFFFFEKVKTDIFIRLNCTHGKTFYRREKGDIPEIEANGEEREGAPVKSRQPMTL